MLRVIGGKYRHRKLEQPSLEITRCTKDSVKEGFFSSLGQDILNCSFLDLFSGSGAIGIEAYSRGAKKVTLVDSSREANQIIKKNLSSLDIKDIDVIFSDYEAALNSFSKNNVVFDMVFVDPPYKMSVDNEFVKHLNSLNILQKKHTIILEVDALLDRSSFIGYNVKELKYGKTFIYILRSVI